MEELQYEELDFTNDFIFAKVMRNKDLCKKLLEVILGIRIRHIEFPDEQKVIDISSDAKSVRLDVYVEGELENVYNIEMQTTNPRNLPKRSRYYQGMIDLNQIEKGADYSELKTCYVIFICKQDIFHRNRSLYAFENRCVQEWDICLGDETKKVFVNPCGDMSDITLELKNFLLYIDTGKIQDKFTADLQSEVERTKSNKEWRKEYMTLLMRDRENRDAGRKDGRDDGREEGAAEERIKAIADLYAGGGTDEEAEKYLKATKEQMAQARKLLAAEENNCRE